MDWQLKTDSIEELSKALDTTRMALDDASRLELKLEKVGVRPAYLQDAVSKLYSVRDSLARALADLERTPATGAPEE